MDNAMVKTFTDQNKSQEIRRANENYLGFYLTNLLHLKGGDRIQYMREREREGD